MRRVVLVWLLLIPGCIHYPVAGAPIGDATPHVPGIRIIKSSQAQGLKLTQLAGYQMIPRDQLRSRLVQQKRDSYRQCYDQRCQIELGKAVAAEKSLATKLLRAGTSCALTSLLYDLRTEAPERAATVKTQCGEEALLNAMEELAAQLAGNDDRPVRDPVR